MPRTKRPTFTNEELALRGIDYVNKKDAIKTLESQCKECRKPLEAFVDAEGKELPSGSIIAVLQHADLDVYLKKTLRTSKVLTPEAIDVLRAEGLNECIENIPTVREDVIELLYEKGKISDEVLSKVYQPKTSYAFSVELKERFNEEA